MQLRAVVYVSTASPAMSSDRTMDDLLRDARHFNSLCGVTGALLHSDGNFLQYFEGPLHGVSRVYQRILNSSKHKDLIELLDTPIETRELSAWTMGFAETSASELQSMAQSQWSSELERLAASPSKSSGLRLLLDYWARTSRKA